MEKRLVYIIDDDKIASMITERMLLSIAPELSIEVFSNPETAIHKICSEGSEPSHIFLDLKMPSMNGWQFLDQTEERIPSDCEVFILTSSIDDRDRAKANRQISEYLVKPVNHEALKKALKMS